MRPALLYISVNDGTDTRIYKEIKSLSADFDISFIGVITPTSTPSMLPSSCRTIFIQGLRRSPLTIAKIFFRVAYLRPWSFKSIHVINENLALVLYPLLWLSRRWVLDVFDSFFLKSTSRLTSFFKVILQRMIYSSADVILVTDDARLNLLPAWSRNKARVLPNYPLTDKQAITFKAEPVGPLKIFFSGSIGVDRGLPFLLNLIKQDPQLQVHVAGWLYDQACEELCKHPQVTYHGIVHQSAAAQIAKQCDYILCLYEPNITNNIYASPNKIYDGIQAGVPVIINQEVLVSSFVRDEKLGIVIDSYNPTTVVSILEELKRQRNQFTHIAQMQGKYTWEKIEPVLISAHSKSQ
jgi:glycosyltransferase involved in cell wall biosynthesis